MLELDLLDEMNARLGQGACRGIQDAYSVTPEASWQFVDGHVIHKSQKNKNTVYKTKKQEGVKIKTWWLLLVEIYRRMPS